MPLRGIERDNVANEIPQDLNASGDRHYVSFEFYPFHEGMTFAVYKGLLSSEARRGKTFCVVKALMDPELSFTQLNDSVKRAKEAQRLAVKFNSIVGFEAVSFQIPCLAEVQRVSDFVGLFRCFVPHEKQLSLKETVVIEEFIDGNFAIFNTSNGTVPTINANVATSRQRKKTSLLPKKLKLKKKIKSRETIRENSKDSKSKHSTPIGPNNLAQAFSHFTWQETNRLVVCDLKGVVSNNSYVFSNPTIHSMDYSYGSGDRGPVAISEVFRSHRCTNVCREWGQFTIRGSNNAKNQVNFCEQLNDLQYQQRHQQEQQQQPQERPMSVTSLSNKNICTYENKLI